MEEKIEEIIDQRFTFRGDRRRSYQTRLYGLFTTQLPISVALFLSNTESNSLYLAFNLALSPLSVPGFLRNRPAFLNLSFYLREKRKELKEKFIQLLPFFRDYEEYLEGLIKDLPFHKLGSVADYLLDFFRSNGNNCFNQNSSRIIAGFKVKESLDISKEELLYKSRTASLDFSDDFNVSKSLSGKNIVISGEWDRDPRKDLSHKKETFSCAFPDFGLEYIRDPAVSMIDFFRYKRRHGRAILVSCRGPDGKYLLVDSLEGSDRLFDGNILEKTEIFDFVRRSIQQYATDHDYEHVVYSLIRTDPFRPGLRTEYQIMLELLATRIGKSKIKIKVDEACLGPTSNDYIESIRPLWYGIFLSKLPLLKRFTYVKGIDVPVK